MHNSPTFSSRHGIPYLLIVKSGNTDDQPVKDFSPDIKCLIPGEIWRMRCASQKFIPFSWTKKGCSVGQAAMSNFDESRSRNCIKLKVSSLPVATRSILLTCKLKASMLLFAEDINIYIYSYACPTYLQRRWRGREEWYQVSCCTTGQLLNRNPLRVISTW